MDLDRRTLLLGGAATVGVGALAARIAVDDEVGSAGPNAAARDSTPFDPSDWTSVREQFDLRADGMHFAAFVLAAHPAPVRAAIERHRLGLDADTEGYLHEQQGPAEERVRRAAADYLGVAADEIAFTESTTAGLGLLYGGLRLGAGDDVVTTEHDFYSSAEALRLNAEAAGATVRRIRLYDDPSRASAEQIVDRIRSAVEPRTRVVAVTWVHSSTGVMLPIRAIADALASINASRAEGDRALLCVDRVHGLGVDATDVTELGCDFLVAGTHKWLFGPRGTGLIWGRAAAWQAVRPVIPSFSAAGFSGWLNPGSVGDTTAELATPGGYRAFEHRWALAEAFQFQSAIGKPRIANRTREQATQLKEGLGGLPGVRVVTPRDPGLSAGIVCCSVSGMEPSRAVTQLKAGPGVIASVTPYRESYLRIGPSIVTDPGEVDAAVRAVADLR